MGSMHNNFAYEFHSSYSNGAGPSSRPHNPYAHTNRGGPTIPQIFMRPEAVYEPQQQAPPPLTNDPSFDILEWHPAYQSCQRFFLDHAQHEQATQALCALINIRLPFQYRHSAITSSDSSQSAHDRPSSSQPSYSFNFPRPGSVNLPSPGRSRENGSHPTHIYASLVPYIRRLIVTGFDKAPILHGFFGDDYIRGIMPHLDCERRNYLFAAKHGGWRTCKKQYDVGSGTGEDETVPFMKPLDEAKIEELTAAEKAWSGWLEMEDWMLGPRAPKEESGHASGVPSSGEVAHNGGNDNMPDGVGDAFRHS